MMRAQMANLFREARQKNKLTQRNIADSLNLASAQYVSNIERGTAPLSAGHFKKVSKILNVSMYELLLAHCSDYEQITKTKAGMK